ncbi:MAG: hypothetical protein V3S29_08930 [bacterium]
MLVAVALHGLQGLQGLAAAAQGLHGLQGFAAAAQGLHGFWAAQGLHGLQGFLAAQGLHGLAVLLSPAMAVDSRNAGLASEMAVPTVHTIARISM